LRAGFDAWILFGDPPPGRGGLTPSAIAMKIFYSDHHPVPLPERHSFPEGKYRRLRHRLLRSSVSQLIDLVPADAATRSQLELVHEPEYVARVASGDLDRDEQRRLGLPWSRELYVRAVHSVGGTIAACRVALRDGAGVNLGGGTHHAFRSLGSGFCVFNDVVVATRVLQRERLAGRVAILDCDVHQGDGTAELAAGDPSIFTFSIHGARNFPFRKKTSDLDVALPNDADDQTYLDALRSGIGEVMDTVSVDLAIYLAGADPFVGDRFGRLAMTKNGLEARDAMVLGCCRERDLPVAIVMGGGYARDVEDIVDIHARTIETALELFDGRIPPPEE
jgi:acetoin utilization deacetylase AcuC-like enzyme